jgi:hypothetical protein
MQQRRSVWLIVAALIVSSGMAGACDSTPKTDEAAKVLACVYAQAAIKPVLKSPSTADFPWCSSSMVTVGPDHTFVITSYVDSQNGFGAMVRTNYMAKMKWAGPGTSDFFMVEFTPI